MIWISTSCHGYLKVSVSNKELIKSKFKPSRYSFIQKGHWYLEEDIDAPNFMKKIWKKNWQDIFQRLPVEYHEHLMWEPK